MAYNVTGSQIIKNKIAIVTKELVLIMIKIYCKKIIAMLINGVDNYCNNVCNCEKNIILPRKPTQISFLQIKSLWKTAIEIVLRIGNTKFFHL